MLIQLVIIVLVFVALKRAFGLNTYTLRNGYRYAIQDTHNTDSLDRLVYLRTCAFKIADELQKQGRTKKLGSVLRSRMSRCVLGDSYPPGNIAVTINKGEYIHICIRDRDGNLLSIQHTVYVFLHELAHVICDSIGHTNEFHENMSLLVETASRLSIYDKATPPSIYCGVHVNPS